MPTFIYYPRGAETFTTFDLNLINDDPTSVRVASETRGYIATRVDRGSFRRIAFEGIYSIVRQPDTVRNLRNMIEHLKAGGRVAYARDKTKTRSFFRSPPPVGETNLSLIGDAARIDGPIFFTGVFSVGDELRIEDYGPGARAEYATITATPAGSLTLGSGISQQFPGRIYVRHAYCYPVLRLPESQFERDILPTLPTATGLVYQLRMTLVEEPGEIFKLAGLGNALATGTLKKRQGGVTLDEAIGGVTGDRQGSGSGVTGIESSDTLRFRGVGIQGV